MDWDKLRIFHSVADAGSFTHAGEVLNLSQSAVSRQISALEASLNCHLFHRHARGLLLTEQGELLDNTVREIFSKLAMVEAQLNESKERPTGPLKITTTIGFGSVWLTPHMKGFIDLYPDIDVNLHLTDGEVDLAMREADVAIRLSQPTQPDLIQRHLATLDFQIYASPEYVKDYGMPKTPQDLDDHRLVVYGAGDLPMTANLNYLLEVGANPEKPRHAIVEINNIYGIFKAVQNGIGLGLLPGYMGHLGAANLIPVLPEVEGPETEIYFVYPEEQRHSMRIKVLRDYLLQAFSRVGKRARK
ncbi:MAG: LysR family transcriptional regulator [Alphaproteobacteria bacterium]|nr:LysR family transcriptional regulator [Rhodospirillales bacterium]MCW9046236.1 LysR family transcriptional regulator [Alphaproteobacteria bacterium]